MPAVLRSLRQLQQQPGSAEAGATKKPMLFATMSGGARHGGATTAFQCRMFQNSPDSTVTDPSLLRTVLLPCAMAQHWLIVQDRGVCPPRVCPYQAYYEMHIMPFLVWKLDPILFA